MYLALPNFFLPTFILVHLSFSYWFYPHYVGIQNYIISICLNFYVHKNFIQMEWCRIFFLFIIIFNFPLYEYQFIISLVGNLCSFLFFLLQVPKFFIQTSEPQNMLKMQIKKNSINLICTDLTLFVIFYWFHLM